jgi:mannose-1-phosphate guanylyltransferase
VYVLGHGAQRHRDYEHLMGTGGNTWAIVLAAGDGSRLHSLTTTESGIAIPKQFCSLRGGRSLLRTALQRAQAIAPPARICIVVARQHRHWWSAELAGEPASNIIIQPSNRGTAIGILLPLLHIMARDPDARIVLLPSDHHIRDEHVLSLALQSAEGALDAIRDGILLLGMPPQDAEPDLGYILPGTVDGPAVHTVLRFVEKPDRLLARILIDAGALWNTFIMAARAQPLLEVFLQLIPQIVAGMRAVIDHNQCIGDAPDAVIDLYRALPEIDFARQFLQNSALRPRVLRVEECGWSDLGTPMRVAETLGRLPIDREVEAHVLDRHTGWLNLATQHARHQASALRRSESTLTPHVATSLVAKRRGE